MDPEALRSEAVAAIAAAGDLAQLEELRIRFFGRKSELKQALRDVRDRETGMALNAVRVAIETALDERQAALEGAELERTLRDDVIDVTLPGAELRRGRYHLITQIRREVEDLFLGLGYEVFDGREVETVHHNFEALNVPAEHPSRSHGDTFYLDDDTVLRTHTSNAQIRVMESRQPPIYIVSLGRVYRRDTPDATHMPVFHQVEGLAVDAGITFADLKGTLLAIARQLFGDEREIRLRTSYFPFTEPSAELDISCFLCNGAGCSVCGRSGWIEMGGAGFVDPNVFTAVGYDPETVSGFAFGLGLERIAMLRHGLPDLRQLWENDLRFARQF
jgi:phenylalanyl-tRNA synthetase alpha chain